MSTTFSTTRREVTTVKEVAKSISLIDVLSQRVYSCSRKTQTWALLAPRVLAQAGASSWILLEVLATKRRTAPLADLLTQPL